MIAYPSSSLCGEVYVPGDKSLSHRALMCGLLSKGRTRIHGLLDSQDIGTTRRVCQALGAHIQRQQENVWEIHSPGLRALRQPREDLYFGNSGTGVRLMMGIVATHPIGATFTGDASLCRRPMKRVLLPLEKMGARIVSPPDSDLLPLKLCGTIAPAAIDYVMPIPSAQVKSAILFAALAAEGWTRVCEQLASRDHTERMLAYFGAEIRVEDQKESARDNPLKHIHLCGQAQPLEAQEVWIAGDFSSGAFPLVAALIVPGSDIILRGLLMNPLRIGLLKTLWEMGGRIEILSEQTKSGEPIADLRIKASRLRGIVVPKERAASMIDEYPILAIAAAYAQGLTSLQGLEELRVKESNRLQALEVGLQKIGIPSWVVGDDLLVEGQGGCVPGGTCISVDWDHRIAMSFLIAGLGSQKPIRISDGGIIATSFPSFPQTMQQLGADIRAA